MSFCQHCGKELSADARFCISCGMPVNAEITTVNAEEQQKSKEEYVPQSVENELSEPIKGIEKTFTLCDKKLVISDDKDTFNAYRSKFREIAKICSDNAVHEYLDKIHDFDSYISLFIEIYERHLQVLTKKAFDILIQEEIYDITYESFHEQHKVDFHSAIDDYNTTIESCILTEEANNQVSSSISGVIQNVMGSYVNKNITNNTLNSFMNGFTEGLLEEGVRAGTAITDAQKRELYGRITPHILFTNIFCDYWNVFLSLTFTLNRYGKNICWLTDDMAQQANNIFQNISNPNFKQEKIVDVLFQIIELFPYNKEYYKFMEDRFGEIKEVETIKKYFGYDFDEVVYSEEKYPKIEQPETKPVQANNIIASNDVFSKLKKETGNVKDMLKSGSSSIFGSVAKKLNKFK